MTAMPRWFWWQSLVIVLLVYAFFAGPSLLSAAAPLVAILAWAYILWAALRERAHAAREATQPVDRSPLSAPTITGSIDTRQEINTIDQTEAAEYLNSHIIGQELVIDQLTRGIYRRFAQERRGKPVFSALLSGPTGTGKTALAKSLTQYLFGDEKFMFRVDCANVIGEAGLQTLIGSPKGYSGSGTWGALTAHLRTTPKTLLLFDEIEKAVPTPTAPMAKLLLSLLDEGIVTEQSDGSKVSATDAVIVLTSNAASGKLASLFEQFKDDPDNLARAAKDALRDFFAPEFLARIDLVTTLAPLGPETRARIISLQVARTAESYGVAVQAVDASFINEALRIWRTREGYGTREVIRWIEEVAADSLISARSAGTERVSIAWSEGAPRIEAL